MTLYNQLKHSGNPQAAIQTIIYLLDKHSPKQVAEIMGISVRWVYTIRKRFLSSGENLSACLLKRGPKNPMPNRTPLHLEKLVVELAKETNLGPQRLAGMLQRSFAISLSPSTIRNILRRYGLRCQKYRTVNGNRRYKADLDKYRPFEFWQIDAKYVADKTALPPEAYAAIFRNNLPKYQFTAIDVKTRLRFIAYAHNLSFSNGLAFMLLVEAWLRSFGVKQRVFFQTDNGQEFGGKATSRKRKVMQRFIFDRLNVSLLNIPEGQKQANAYVERSHRTDDEEFYAINLSRTTSQKAFLAMAQDWIYTYNYKRPHFGVNMAGRTPLEAARYFHSMCHVAIGAMPVVILDKLSMHIGELFDLSKIPWDNSPRNIKILNETMAYYSKAQGKEAGFAHFQLLNHLPARFTDIAHPLPPLSFPSHGRFSFTGKYYLTRARRLLLLSHPGPTFIPGRKTAGKMPKGASGSPQAPRVNPRGTLFPYYSPVGSAGGALIRFMAASSPRVTKNSTACPARARSPSTSASSAGGKGERT